MRKHRVNKRAGLAVLAGGLAFVGAADATELILDGSFENATLAPGSSTVGIGGKTNPGVGGGWSIFSTYLYSTLYALPLTNNVGVNIGGTQFLRPYPSGTYQINNSSDTVTQMVSLTADTTLTPAKIDAGQATYTMSAWFSSYLTQGDFSDLTLTFLDASTNALGTPVMIGGSNFVAALPTAQLGKYADAKSWGKDLQTATVPSGARMAEVLIHATPVAGAPDGYVDLVSLDVVDKSIKTPFVSSAIPPDKAINVGPIVSLTVNLRDGTTAVDTNSVKLYLDNNPVPATVQKTDTTNTTVKYNAGLLAALSAHTYSVAFSDNGTPATALSNSFNFTVANYLTLPSSLASPLGSEDSAKPGFNVSVYQVQLLDPVSSITLHKPPSIEFDEGMLIGLAGTNAAELTGVTSTNTYAITNSVHWANSTGTTPNFPGSDPFPGIPGTLFTEDDFVDDIRTYIRFPTSGFYQMGVNNNDEFRLAAEGSGTLSLKLTAPTNLPVLCVAIATNVTQLLFGGALPLTPLSAQVVYATPSGNSDDSCNLATNTALAGKIALLDRGTTNCTSAGAAFAAQQADAVAVIETTPGDPGYPIRLTDNDPRVTIPVLDIADNFGGLTIKSYLTNHQTVTASIVGDPAPRLVEWNGPKGFGSADSLVGFAVPSAGVYPFRLVDGHSSGAADLEWFSIQPDGTRILINDSSNTNALLAFRARTAATPPLAMNPPTLSNGQISISWTGSGTLQEATSVSGPWQASSSQANPQTVPTTSGSKFYRVKSP
jgi:hypothetical protein